MGLEQNDKASKALTTFVVSFAFGDQKTQRVYYPLSVSFRYMGVNNSKSAFSTRTSRTVSLLSASF